jgi:hypothetical protein
MPSGPSFTVEGFLGGNNDDLRIALDFAGRHSEEISPYPPR